jgi:hypothetical protein
LGAFIRSLFVLAAVLVCASPAPARVAAIRTTAPLADATASSVEAAFSDAIEAALRGALAMRLPHVAVNRALVLREVVVVELLTTDVAPDDEDDTASHVSTSWPGAGAFEVSP